MKLKLLQSQVGRFNLLGHEETYVFSLGLVRGDGEVEEREGVKAILYYSGEPEVRGEMEDYMERADIGDIFRKCFEYAKNVCSSRDYMAEALLFIKLYQSAADEIQNNWKLRENANIQKQIDVLQKRLSEPYKYMSVEYVGDVVTEILQDEIDKYRRWQEANLEKAKEFVEGAEGKRELLESNADYQRRIDSLLLCIPPC